MSEYFDLRGAVITAKLDKAIQVRHKEIGTQWIPESCLHSDSELYVGCKVGDTGALCVLIWFAEKKGWL
jgi:hypothetical protein